MKFLSRKWGKIRMKTKGWSKVLKFTYIQTVKAKPFIISCAVIFALFTIMMFLANFLPGVLKDDEKTIVVTDENGNVIGEEKATFKIDKVYILNISGLDMDFSFLDSVYVKHEDISENQKDAITAKITGSESPEVLAVFDKDGNGYKITMSRPENAEIVSNDDCYPLLNTFAAVVKNANLVALGIDADELANANAPVSTSVNVNGEAPKSELASVLASTSKMIVSIVMFIAIFTYAQSTAQSIATEKSSRVMELLLTSIKPLAVIIGKVLAMALVSLTSIVGLVGVMALEFAIIAPMGTLGEIFGMADTKSEEIKQVTQELNNTFSGVGLKQILLIVFVFIMGFLFFSLISGLIGATISKIEDLQTAMQPFAIISVLGFYLSYFAPISGMTGESGSGKLITRLSYYLPISSPFALPGAILSGEISAAETAIAVAVLALCLVLFAMFVAKVYESVILYTGTRLKIKDMVKMAKNG